MSGIGGVSLVLFVWCHGWAVIWAGMNSGAPAAQWLCQLCASQRRWEMSKVPQVFLCFQSQKMRRCLNRSMLESIFLHLQVKSSSQSCTSLLTKKYTEVHLCLKSFSIFPFQVKFQSEGLCKGNGAAVQQEVQGSQQSSFQAHSV